MVLSYSNEKAAALNKQEPSKLVKFGGRNGNALLYFIVAIATTGFSLFGYDQGELIMRLSWAQYTDWYLGLMSGIIASPQFNREFPAVSPTRRLPLHNCALADPPLRPTKPTQMTSTLVPSRDPLLLVTKLAAFSVPCSPTSLESVWDEGG
jgi:hypothetical protein